MAMTPELNQNQFFFRKFRNGFIFSIVPTPISVVPVNRPAALILNTNQHLNLQLRHSLAKQQLNPHHPLPLAAQPAESQGPRESSPEPRVASQGRALSLRRLQLLLRRLLGTHLPLLLPPALWPSVPLELSLVRRGCEESKPSAQ
jgi:hypothetical protein